MGITSKKTTNANKVKSEVEDLILSIAIHSNGNYEVDGIIFASRFVFTTIESIDRNLRFLYTPGSDSNDWETINHSLSRENEASFDFIFKHGTPVNNV